MTFEVHIKENEEWHKPIHMINGDSCVIECPGGIVARGKNAVLKWKIKNLEKANRYLAARIVERDVKSLEGATVDELLDELKLRSEHFV